LALSLGFIFLSFCVGVVPDTLAADHGRVAWFSDNATHDAFTNVVPIGQTPPFKYVLDSISKADVLDYSGACSTLDEAIKLYPDLAPFYSLRAMALHNLGRQDEAFADVAKAIKLNPQYAGSYNTRGNVELYSFRHYDDALADFNKAIDLSPRYASAYVNRALLKRETGDLGGAIEDLNKIIAIGSERAPAYLLRGCIKSDLFQFQDALLDFRKQLEVYPAGVSAEVCWIRIWQIRARQGELTEATGELADHLKNLPKSHFNRWPIPVERYLLDKIPEAEVINSLKTYAPCPRLLKTELCEANYYMGMKRLLAGDKTGAATYFQQAIDTDVVADSARDSAKAELNALKK
jgi:tetratricopeptide (TPR) repeat protein